MHMHVDDLFGITLKRFLEADMATAREVCEELLGSESMAEDKWEIGSSIAIAIAIAIIGWHAC